MVVSKPRPAVQLIASRVAIYNEFLDISVDGVAVPRPESKFNH